MDTEQDPGPDPGDVDGWRRAIDEGRLSKIRIENVVAALQKIGPLGDQRVVNPLMLHVSSKMMRKLRHLIGKNHRNQGRDMIEHAHGKLIEAVLKPKSADGIALRDKFYACVRHRAADAIRVGRLDAGREPHAEDKGVLPPPPKQLLTAEEEKAHIESVLRQIQDPRKRSAFRLHMDGVPRGSKKVDSIAKALNVSVKTIETWINETKEQIRVILGEQP
jgi:RNA polymerase sigma factor (sigma-70 family)